MQFYCRFYFDTFAEIPYDMGLSGLRTLKNIRQWSGLSAMGVKSISLE